MKIQPEKCTVAEAVYADGSDFINEDRSVSKVLKEIVKECLGRFDLLRMKKISELTVFKRKQSKTEMEMVIKVMKIIPRYEKIRAALSNHQHVKYGRSRIHKK